MDINVNKQPAIASAPFGMSACGHALGTTGTSTTFVGRDRMAETLGDKGFDISAYVPGTTAWSPSIS